MCVIAAGAELIMTSCMQNVGRVGQVARTHSAHKHHVTVTAIIADNCFDLNQDRPVVAQSHLLHPSSDSLHMHCVHASPC